MNGALLGQMRDDNKKILDEGGFQTDVTIRTRSGVSPVVEVVIPATITYHNTHFDPETGVYVNARTAHCIFNLGTLVDLGFPVYIGKIPTEPDIKDSIVTFVDASGKTNTLKIAEARPSHSFGCVSVILGG